MPSRQGDPSLLDSAIARELLTSTIPARLAYTWMDGTPRLTALWFHWDGTDMVMSTFRGAPKLKALSTGSRVAIMVDTNEPPNHVLTIRGAAQVTAVEGIVPEYALAAARYLGKEQAEAYLQSLPPTVPMTRIAVRPDHVVLLDFTTRFPSALSSLGIAR